MQIPLLNPRLKAKIKLRHLLVIAAFLPLSLTLSGCEGTRLPPVFKINIQQGNIVTEDMLAKLEPGMTRTQVNYVLGSPVLQDPYHPERWNYVYTLKLGHAADNQDQYREQFITVIFDGDGLYSHYEGELYEEKLNDQQEDIELEKRVKNRKRELKKAE